MMGRNTATILASTYVIALACLVADVARAQTWPSVATDLPRTGGGEDDVAVVVGISDYFALQDVPGAADNARDWFQYLVRVRGVPSARASLLVDADATRGKIERALKAAAASARPNGRAIVVFVGHGAPAPSGDDGLLLGVDTQGDADSLAERGVPQELVASIMATGKQRETVLLYDACFSGMTNDGKAPLVPGNQATLPNRRIAPKQSTVVLSASESFAGPLPGQQRPAFSYVMLGALRGWADADRSKDVSLTEAFSFTNDTMRAALKQSQRAPQMRGSASTLAFAKTAEEPPDVSAILLGRCPDNTKWSGRACVSAGCPAGTMWNGSACLASAAAVQCPSGTTWSGSACVASSVTCPAGTTWKDGACRGAVAAAPVAAPVASPAPARAAQPSGDADGDRIADADDQCPREPETINATDDEDGCPDRGRIVVTEHGLELLDKIYFEYNKGTIKTESMPVVQGIARVLSALQRAARIECHSDERGADQHNLRLTQERADSVRAAIMAMQLPLPTITAVGYGETRPLDAGHNEAAWSKNRRCEVRWADRS